MTDKNRLKISLALDLTAAAFNVGAALYLHSLLLATFAGVCVLVAVANVVLFKKRLVTRYFVLFYGMGDAEVDVPDGEGAYVRITKEHPGRRVKDFWPMRTEYVHIELTGRSSASKISLRGRKN